MSLIRSAFRALKFTASMWGSYLSLDKDKFRQFSSIAYKYFAQLNLEKTSMKKLLNNGVLSGVKICLDDEEGGTPNYEQVIIGAICQHIKPKRIFEIGTYRGKTTLTMLLNIDEDAVISTLDLPMDAKTNSLLYSDLDKYDSALIEKEVGSRTVGTNYQSISSKGRIVQLFGDSATFDYAPFYNKMDLIFIDGAHSKKYVESDTANAEKMISESGLILWHDYRNDSCEPVREFLHERAKKHSIFQIEDTMIAIQFYGRLKSVNENSTH